MTISIKGRDSVFNVPHRQQDQWSNWAKNVRCQPEYLFLARSVEDLSQIVRFARENGKHIRVVASGHSWSALVPTDDILVDITRINRVTLELGDPAKLRVTMECGATVKEVNDVLEAAGYVLPFNVVLESVRYGGLIATGSHGSGWDHCTLSDLVHAIEIITANGELRRFETGVDSEDVMNAARLNLGMFGLIYRITLNIQRSWIVRARDQRIRIPEVLENLSSWVPAHDNMDLFWWPLVDRFWVKTWDRVEDQAITARPRYDQLDRIRIAFEMRMYQQMLDLQMRIPKLTPSIMPLTFAFSPSRNDQIVDIVEAIHYRRSIEVTRMGCVEIAFKVDPDFTNVRAAIQTVLDTTRAYARRGEYPFNVTMNVRFIHNSNCWLSPAYGEGHTCYIEILSRVKEPLWFGFSGEVARAWLELPHALPHWAKEYRHITGIIDHVRREMGNNIARFNQIKADLGIDPNHMFVNDTLRELFRPE